MYRDIELLETDSPEEKREFVQRASLRWTKDNNGIGIVFESKTEEIRAKEFLEFLVDDCGMVKGDAARASAVVSKTMMDMLVSSAECDNVYEYMEKRTRDYFVDCQSIDANQFTLEDLKDAQINEYRKKMIPWAFVPSDVLGELGDVIVLKSLENESGVELSISEDLYIMIGCRGEVYHISAEKFNNTYQETEEDLDIFEQMFNFLPEIKLKKTNEFVSIDDKAKLCYPKSGVTILATPLQRRTKVFYGEKNEDYFLGREGDYLVIRKDDGHDVYIVEKNIFHQTYEMV
ncbi:MAG: hypothetical protein ACI4AQ_10425 [Lachnospiraceae bacterium]